MLLSLFIVQYTNGVSFILEEFGRCRGRVFKLTSRIVLYEDALQTEIIDTLDSVDDVEVTGFQSSGTVMYVEYAHRGCKRGGHFRGRFEAVWTTAWQRTSAGSFILTISASE